MLGEKGCRSRRPALEPRANDTQTPSSQTRDGGWTSGRGLLNRKARHCCAQRCGHLPAVKRPPESSLPPCPPGNRTPLPAHRRSVLLSQAGTLAPNASRKRRQEELRSRRPVCDTPHTPTCSSRGGASFHPPASAPQNCGFQGSEKVPQLVSLKKFKDEPGLASLTFSGSETCTNLLGHMQARTHSRANSNRLLAPREARPGECGTLPGHGLPATLWPQRGPLVSRAPEGELAVRSSCRRGRVGTACVQSSQTGHALRRRTWRFLGVRPRAGRLA